MIFYVLSGHENHVISSDALGDTHTVGPTLNAYSVTELYLFNYRKGDANFVTPHLCDRIADPLLLVLLIGLRTPSFQGRFIWLITTNCNSQNGY